MSEEDINYYFAHTEILCIHILEQANNRELLQTELSFVNLFQIRKKAYL